jgi:hypothetical protein
MRKRIATILAPTDLGASGTRTINVELKESISRIDFVWKATVATVSVMLDAVLAAISKIELVDGSEVLASVSGKEAQAQNFYDRREMPFNRFSLTIGGFHKAVCSLDFGRFLWDKELAFDPTKYSNPQLKITWNEDAANTSIVVNTFQIYAHVMSGPDVNPIGYLSTREFYSYAMAASGNEYIDLPTDLALRNIMIQGESTDHAPDVLFDNLKISADNDAFVPLNMDGLMYGRIIVGQYPKIVEAHDMDAVVTAKTIYANVAKGAHISIEYDGTAFVTAQSLFAVATYTGALIELAASVDIQADTAIIAGTMPHSCFPVNFGDQMDIDSWMSMADIGSLKATLLASSDADSGDTTRIITQQLRRY